MKNTLTDNGITATVKQIRKKLTDVKNFYGDQKRMSQSLKSSAAGTDMSMQALGSSTKI